MAHNSVLGRFCTCPRLGLGLSNGKPNFRHNFSLPLRDAKFCTLYNKQVRYTPSSECSSSHVQHTYIMVFILSENTSNASKHVSHLTLKLVSYNNATKWNYFVPEPQNLQKRCCIVRSELIYLRFALILFKWATLFRDATLPVQTTPGSYFLLICILRIRKSILLLSFHEF